MKKWIGILSVAIFIVLSGCDSKSGDAQSDASIIEKASDAVVDTTKKAVDATKEAASDAAKAVDEKVVEPVKEATKNAVDATKEAAKKTSDAVVDTTKKAVDATKEAASDAAKAVDEKVVEPVKKTVAEPSAAAAKASSSAANLDAGKALYTPCISCHGTKAEKKALGKSQVIAGWDKQKITDALKGYKNKTYGGAMKTIMYGQAGKLSEEQIEQLGAYISSL